VDVPVLNATGEQLITVEMLASEIDDLEVMNDPSEFPDEENWLVFDGQGQDGPAVGYIKPNGEISWICQG
jgi:hypothetical protein